MRGLVYSNTPLEDLVTKDTDGDGVLDWEEALWGTDPTKTDTDGDGITDKEEIEGLKAEAGVDPDSIIFSANAENLTETDKFARELFTTAAALSQGGALDEETIDAIGNSLAENFYTSKQRKIFTITDIKTIDNESKETTLEYGKQLGTIQEKYPLGKAEDVAFTLLNSITPEGETDVAALNKLDPTINQLNNIVRELAITDTPRYIAPMHLLIINEFQHLSENISDMKKIEDDPVVALGAINTYEENLSEISIYLRQLFMLINMKLNS